MAELAARIVADVEAFAGARRSRTTSRCAGRARPGQRDAPFSAPRRRAARPGRVHGAFFANSA